MAAQPILTSERLFLYESTLEDAPFYHQLMNSPGWLEHIGDRGIRSVQDAEKHIRDNIIPHYQTHGYGLFNMVLKATSEPIGLCGLLKRDYLDAPDIGFALLPEHARQGYTYEAGMAVLEFAQAKLGSEEVLAITSLENTASQNLLVKLGLESAGEITPQEETILLYRKIFA